MDNPSTKKKSGFQYERMTIKLSTISVDKSVDRKFVDYKPVLLRSIIVVKKLPVIALGYSTLSRSFSAILILNS